MIGLCDNCALKYADCKGNKDKEKCRCDYYKKPNVFNAKEAAVRIAELQDLYKHSQEQYYELMNKTRWIPVTERLPEIEDGSLISESVLGTDNYGNIRHVRLELRCVEPRFCTEEEGMGINIIAWMPLPEPYKEGDTNDKAD